jgi:SAM-dependent methyltransferase
MRSRYEPIKDDAPAFTRPSIFHKLLRTWLAHPLTREVDIDDPRALELRYQIIREKRFLRRIYQEWYFQLVAALPSVEGAVLEIGAGAGFLREYLPDAITSDVLQHSGVDVVMDGLDLPLPDAALRGIVMLDVLHHLSEPRRFFLEAARCVRPGGAIVMIEPWVTPWSKLIYTNFHHERFRTETPHWEFPSTGPLSGANGALPWILFERDRAQFEREFPDWRIQSIRIQMPFRYLVSGGVSMRALTPSWSFGFWRALEGALQPWMRSLGMCAFIKLERTTDGTRR